ncbi:MAG: hypothetical protein FP814_00140 [Desulfobacterium sp.]|nr:hypothetical protein [Desulfobacterium sp.]MBU3949982.1 hypothetical protein [Pseudomonadota bacterium]MBU4035432.1 hypothetical protein [Pseudomonadota bacterium]
MKYIISILLVCLSSNVYGDELKRNYLSTELSVFSGLTIVTDYYSCLVKIYSEAYEYDDVVFRAGGNIGAP